MNRTLVLIKPDGVQRRLMGEIIGRLEKKGLKVTGMKLMQASRQLAEQFYMVHKGKPFFGYLVDQLLCGPLVAMVVEGRNAHRVVRDLMGPTDGTKAPPGTIRGDFCISIQKNLMHGSDCPESAEKEIALWFPGSFVLSSNKKSGRSKRTEFELVEEMVTYEMCDETCLQNDIPTRPQKSRDPYEFLYLPY